MPPTAVQPYRPPRTPPALPAYSARREPLLPHTHRYCVDCRQPLPRTEFSLIFRDDPYGLAEAAVDKMRRRFKLAGMTLSEARIRRVRARVVQGARLAALPANPKPPKPQQQACPGVMQRVVASISSKRALLMKTTDELKRLKTKKDKLAVARQELKVKTAASRLVFVLHRWFAMVELATKNMDVHLATKARRVGEGKDTDEVDGVLAKLKAVLALGGREASRGCDHAENYGKSEFVAPPVLDLAFDYNRSVLHSGGKPFDVAGYVAKEGLEEWSEWSAPPSLIDRQLRTQPRCRKCDLLRSNRRGAVGSLRRTLRSYGVTLTSATDFSSVAIVGEVPEAVLSTGILEDLGSGGVALVDETGEPRFPQDPTAALRASYSLLFSDRWAKRGALGPVRVKVLQRVTELAKLACNRAPALAARADDVVDVVLVREEGALASVAMERLLSRHWRRVWRRADSAIKSGALDAHEASARLAEGIFDAAISWDPLHESGAGLGTHVFNRAGRALQLRGKKDFAIAATKGDDGHWTGGAQSLASCSVRDGDAGDAMRSPNAVVYSAGHAALGVGAVRLAVSWSEAVRHDVREALGALSATDRKIAELLWAEQSRTAMVCVADTVGLRVSEVKARARQIQSLLVVLLADYGVEKAEQESEQESEQELVQFALPSAPKAEADLPLAPSSRLSAPSVFY